MHVLVLMLFGGCVLAAAVGVAVALGVAESDRCKKKLRYTRATF